MNLFQPTPFNTQGVRAPVVGHCTVFLSNSLKTKYSEVPSFTYYRDALYMCPNFSRKSINSLSCVLLWVIQSTLS